jgi:hypothetical protein
MLASTTRSDRLSRASRSQWGSALASIARIGASGRQEIYENHSLGGLACMQNVPSSGLWLADRMPGFF